MSALRIVAIAVERVGPGADGPIRLPDGPGLGITIDPRRFGRCPVDVEVRVGGRTLDRSPKV
jgi:hypothetical protein